MQALWLYIKHNQLQDGHEREYINCNRYFRQVSQEATPLTVSLPCHASSSKASLDCPGPHSSHCPLGP